VAETTKQIALTVALNKTGIKANILHDTTLKHNVKKDTLTQIQKKTLKHFIKHKKIDTPNSALKT